MVEQVQAAMRATVDGIFAVTPRLALRVKARPDLLRAAALLPDAPVGGKNQQEICTEGIGEIFDRTGRSLLLLGAGGSGKSTLLAELCLHLCGHATREDAGPAIPVLLNLTTWSENERSFEQWLAQAIVDAYPAPGVIPSLALEWIEDRALILLLDGLDEIATPKERSRILRQIEAFLAAGPCPIAIACRTDDFVHLNARPSLSRAVEILKPTRDQVNNFLTRLNSPTADSVKAVSPRDRAWWSMISDPIMLGIVAYVSKVAPEIDLVSTGSARYRRRHIIAAYVDTLLRRRAGHGPDYRPQDARRWLAWLATWTKKHGRTEFFVDRLPPSWINDITDIRSLKARPRYWLPLTGTAAVAVAELIIFLGGRVSIAFAVNSMLVTMATTINIRKYNSSWAEPIQLVWTMRGRWIVWSLIGLPFALFGIMQNLLYEARAITEIPLWIVGASLASTPAILALSLTPVTMSNRAGLPPGDRIRRSRRTAWQGALLIGLPIALAIGIVRSFSSGDPALALGSALPFSVVSMTSCWLIFGGAPVLQYRALFRELERSGRGPANYLAFLDWARERLLLQAAGSALRFPHREIQRYLTESWPASQLGNQNVPQAARAN
jgi:hypothetical protein